MAKPLTTRLANRARTARWNTNAPLSALLMEAKAEIERLQTVEHDLRNEIAALKLRDRAHG